MRTLPAATLILAASFGLTVGACSAPSAPADPEAAIDAGAPTVSITVPVVPRIHLDLSQHPERAHVGRGDLSYGPKTPGWARISQLADRGPWQPARWVDGHWVSWLESIGATLHFPVGEEGAGLRELEIWLKPVARGQRVSIFLDEVLVRTLSLEPNMTVYRLPLPQAGLSPGEHTLRFWFRFTRWKGKQRLSAALGGLRLTPAKHAPAPPESWSGPFELAGESPASLYAAPATLWRYHVLPPAGARLFARASVREGPPVTFIVRVVEDEQPPAELTRITVQAATTAPLDVALGPYAERPIRLELATEGEGDAPFGRAAWIEPQIIRPGLPQAHIPPTPNVVLWVIDGLRSDRIGLGRGGERASTPNLDQLAREGAAAVDVWSGGASPAEGHRRLLWPSEAGPGLAATLTATGRRTGLLSASAALTPDLTEGFSTRLDLRRAGEPAETSVILRELDAWLGARGRQPFFLYVATEDPRRADDHKSGFPETYQRRRGVRIGSSEELAEAARQRIRYDAALSISDYWLGQLVALLEVRGLREDTLIVIAGSVGHELGDGEDGFGLQPGTLQVPTVWWHPRLRAEDRARALTQGGDLADVASTLVSLVGGDPPATWPGLTMTTSLFSERPLPPKPSHARSGNQVAARFGHWLLRGPGSRDLRLWNLRDDPATRVELSERRPIALRTLRESMQDHP